MNKLKKKIIQNYAKLTNKRIDITDNGINYMFLSNGSIIQNLKNSNDNMRGSRSRFIQIYDDCDSNRDFDKLLESWFNEEEGGK